MRAPAFAHASGRSGAAAEDVAAAAVLACVLEASAPKPGNVSPGRPFHDARYEDFVASAAAIGPALAAAGERPLGETIRRAVAATRRWTDANTNLGIVLLLAPLARAALTLAGGPTVSAEALRRRVREVVDATTVDDAAELYAGIRLARPGGLGRVESEDVSGAPSVTLAEAMRLAADRDGVAREYATGFAATFEVGAPALRRARSGPAPMGWDDAVVEAYLALLAAAPDTLVARKLGAAAARAVSARAREVLDAGGVRTEAGRRAAADFDRELRDARNTRNPGTTADLTAAAIYVVLLEGGWRG